MKEIINRYLENSANDDEKKVLLEWLKQKGSRSVFDFHKKEWKSQQDKDFFPDEGKETWIRIQSGLLERGLKGWQKSIRIGKIMRYAAILFMLISMGTIALYLWVKPGNREVLMTRVLADNGQMSKVVLPDQSVVWLNSASSVAYDNQFGTKNRKLVLEGEAFFDIVKNDKIPVYVTSGDISILVTGTKFNVNAYSWTEQISVVLESGQVGIMKAGNTRIDCSLDPGEMAVYHTGNKKIEVSRVNTSRFTSWKEGIVNIYDLPLDQVVLRLKTRYNQQFEIDESVRHYHYTFSIKNEPLPEIIALIEKITPVKAEQEGSVITFKPDVKRMKKMVDK